jgi:lipid-binding SYLF domain-containing protein
MKTNTIKQYIGCKLRPTLLVLAVGTFVTISGGAFNHANAMTTADLNTKASDTLHILTANNPIAAELSRKAKAVLIFPNIVKAGLVFGGAYGEGVLKQENAIDGYYNSVTASWGLQAGAQSYGYVIFLMNDNALNYVHKTHGLELGVGPTVVVVNKGIAQNISSTTLKEDAYAFIFDQQGLMAGVSIEGTKISEIHKQ